MTSKLLHFGINEINYFTRVTLRHRKEVFSASPIKGICVRDNCPLLKIRSASFEIACDFFIKPPPPTPVSDMEYSLCNLL